MTQGSELQTLAIVSEFMETMSVSGDVIKALSLSLPSVVARLDCEAGSLFVYDANNDELVCRACVGPVDIAGLRIQSSQGVAGRVYNSQSNEVVSNVSEDKAHHAGSDEKHNFVTQSLLTVPVTNLDHRYGVLQLVNKRSADHQFSPDDVSLAEALARALALGYHSAMVTDRLREQDAITRDIALAETVQSAISGSSSVHKGFAAKVRPYRKLSGDFVDHVETSTAFYFIEADVSGKGVAASLITAQALALFKLFARRGEPVSAIAKQINRELSLAGLDGRFLTAFIGRIDLVTKSMDFLNCGHGDVLIQSLQAPSDFEILPSKAPPLGVVSDAQFNFAADSLQMHKTRLWVVTDGISEAVTGRQVELGVRGLQHIAVKLATSSPADALATVFSLFDHGKLATHDDATLLLVDADEIHSSL